ncbi:MULTISPECIES: hypothetical protein [unclassified Synechococcus]|uniref:hypothetical protein n=1 Tax=unclassified Synechococcus TaxID=2626047 RepID=UPI0039AEBE05
MKLPTSEIDGSAADRYYAMAEEMNTRGAMELAVPFYRQTVALLLAERQAFQQQLGASATNSVGAGLPMDALNGLLKAAETIGQAKENKSAESSTEAAFARPSIEIQIAELSAELSKENALQVMAGLRALSESNGGKLPATGLSLLGKAQMLLGNATDGLKSFEAASSVAPDDREIQINVGAARLVQGDVEGALDQLRGVWSEGFDNLQSRSQQPLLRNLSAAEAKSGFLAGALQLRLKWFQLNPQANPLERWLCWAKQGLEGSEKDSSLRMAALALLEALQKAQPEDLNLLQHLADALEDQGDYREASLLYQQLLRPQQT